jgi:uncharacterized protein
MRPRIREPSTAIRQAFGPDDTQPLARIRSAHLKRILPTIIVALVAALVTSTSMGASSKEAIVRADALEKEQDYPAIIGTLEPYADSGDGEIEIRLATAYLNLGINGSKAAEIDNEDMRHALEFAQRAANHGQAIAFNLLYQFYGNGWGVPVDNVKALIYLKRGAQGGDVGAKLNFAINLYSGSPIAKRDLNAACTLFRDLAKDKSVHEVASYYLGTIVFRGQCGFTANRIEGVRMIEVSANQGLRDAERDMGKNFEFGWSGKADMSKAFAWYRKSADQGDAESEWRIGMAYVNGELGPKDSARGVKYLEQSAQSDFGKGMVDMGVMYATGDAVPKDFDKARMLYEKAADLGEPHAFRELAAMYAVGEGVSVDFVRARVMYLQSVELGEADASSFRKAIEANLDASQLEDSDQLFEAWRGKRAGRPHSSE